MSHKAAETKCAGERKKNTDLDKTTFLIDQVSPLVFAWLVETVEEREKVIRIAKEFFSLGSAKHNDLQVTGEDVAEVHCQVYFSDGFFEINDHNTKRGTWVNGQPVRRQRLNDNDRLRVGTREFLFKCFRDGEHG